jgi:hypothetical protein
MKISVKASEIVDGVIDFVSLVSNGANRSPFKIIKAEEQEPSWLAHLPEFRKLQQRFAAPESVSKETRPVKMKEVIADMSGEPVQKAEDDQIRKTKIAKLRHKVSGLYDQQQNLWERPNTPAFKKFDDNLSFAIEKAESELRLLGSGDDLIDRSSAFFFRGGTSNYCDATLYDSADQRHAAVRKGDSQIDLSPINTQSDFNRINKADDGEVRD